MRRRMDVRHMLITTRFEIANAICAKLGAVWHNRGGQIKKNLYWTRKTKATAVLWNLSSVTMRRITVRQEISA